MARELAAYMRDPISTFERLAGAYGDVVKMTSKPTDTYLINDPDLIEDILVTRDWNFVPVRPVSFGRAFHMSTSSSEGYFHRRHRPMFEAPLQPDHIGRFAHVVTECAGRLRDSWREGAEVDIEQDMARLMSEVMGQLMFGSDTLADPRERDAAVDAANFIATRPAHPLGSAREALPFLPENRRFWSAIGFLDGIIYRRIAERRASPDAHDDLLALLLKARDPIDGQGMSDRQARDEVVSIYMVPSLLMARAMTWTFYLLSGHSDVEERLHAEVDGPRDGTVRPLSDPASLPHTHAVIAESMRLYPPSWIVGRTAVQDFDIGGYTPQAGSTFILSAMLTQRDERYFPDPTRFDMDRWVPEAVAARAEYTYFPFSGGQRDCLGKHFAWLALKLTLATLSEQWRPRLAPEHRVVPAPLFALCCRHGMRMRLERRASS
ncbi:MAG TPA: cytochrome P450 [Thermomicrobiales bacterium]|nr:cytochrome P450 [Thermomicrobiales bacterium]